MMQLKMTAHKVNFAAMCTSILHAGDVGLQVGIFIPLPLSGTGTQLLTEVILNHTQVVWV